MIDNKTKNKKNHCSKIAQFSLLCGQMLDLFLVHLHLLLPTFPSDRATPCLPHRQSEIGSSCIVEAVWFNVSEWETFNRGHFLVKKYSVEAS